MRGELWLTAALGIALAASLFVHASEPDPKPTRADSMRTDEMIQRLHSSGWTVVKTESQKELVRALQEGEVTVDSLEKELRALGRELEVAEARSAGLMEVAASLRGQVVALSERHGPEEDPDSVTAELDDGLLSGRVSYMFAREQFRLDYSAEVPITLFWAEAATRELVAGARSPDPRVSLEVRQARVQLPEPVRVCTWRERGHYAGGGGLVGLVLGLVVR